MRLLPIALFILLSLAVGACANAAVEPPTEPRTLKSWEAGEIGPFGCPFIDPIPWAGANEHQEACGLGCEPMGTQGSFVACVSDDVPAYPYDVFTQARECLRHPVDGKDYLFSNIATAWPLMHMCWPGCGAESIYPGEDFQPPEECFEE